MFQPSISFNIIRIAPLTDDGEGRGQNEGGDGDGGPGHVREPVHVDRVVGGGPLVPRAVQADSTSGKQIYLGNIYLLNAAVLLTWKLLCQDACVEARALRRQMY